MLENDRFCVMLLQLRVLVVVKGVHGGRGGVYFLVVGGSEHGWLYIMNEARMGAVRVVTGARRADPSALYTKMMSLP